MPQCASDESGSDAENKKSSGSEAENKKSSASDNDSSSASSKAKSGTESDSSASSVTSNKSKSHSGSQSGSDSGSGRSKKSPRNKNEIKECWEKNPDIYGIRRSERSKKEPDRLDVKRDSPERTRKNSRRNSRSSNAWNSSVSDSDTDKDIKPRPPRSKPPGGRKTSKPVSRVRARATDKLRKRRFSDSSDDSDDTDSALRRTQTRRAGAGISYKEESEDEKTGSDEVTEVAYDETAAAQTSEPDTADTIERVLATRRGKKGAVGGPTTFYAVDENGDPNDGCDVDDLEATEIQYLIKWKGWSHIHNTWESQQSLKDNKVKGIRKLENYMNKEDDLAAWRRHATPEDIEYFEYQLELQTDLMKSYTNVERVIAQVDKPDGGTDYFVKWESLPYAEASVEDGNIINKKWPKKVKEFLEREESKRTPSKSCRALKYRPKFSLIKSQPTFIGGENVLALRDYQLDGLNWLVRSWCKENSVILADEMGLGKTIQTICFLYYLFRTHQVYGPYLLVVPLSTMTSWQREFSLWAPEINFVIYLGDVTSRNIIRDYEWWHSSTNRLKINAVITTYEIVLKDKAFLGSISWAALLVDEAHRLKNDDSLLYKALAEFDTNHRLLITGTPLQNSLKELWALLHFIMPNKFADWEEFSHHDNAAQKGYTKLHAQLEPFILRRVKKDVEKSLPSKVEQILRVEMSSLQKQYYKWILTKNYGALRKGVKGSTTTFNNIVIELKKCCNHAFLTKPPEADNKSHESDFLQQIVRGSGKLVLLDKLLVRLKETGHRVLIFSQMVRMLDILAEYLQRRRFQFQRLDGSIKGDIRKQALDHFNAENSQDFCFLLSTRAGGLGINLATADTVIIFDSDWNPQNDLQAQARAHRIGQKNQVNIYRLVTKGSVEEEIIERAKKKMVLDHLVIQRMDTTGRTVLDKKDAASSSTPFNKGDLTAILKFGADELFKDEEDGDEEPVCDIDEILKRAETAEEAPTTVGDELLSAFKVASFAAFEEDKDLPADEPEAEDESKDWDDIIPANYRKKVEEDEKAKEMEDLYLPPRSRKTLQQINETDSDGEKKKKKKAEDSEDGSDEASDEEKPRKRGRPKKYALDCEKPFTDAEIRRFIKSYKKFSAPLKRLEAVACEAELQEKPLSDLRKLGEYIEERCKDLMAEMASSQKENSEVGGNEDSNLSGPRKHRLRGPSFKIGRVSLNAKTLLATLKELEPLDEALPSSAEERRKWVLDLRVKAANYDCEWEVDDDSRLLRGIYQYGMGSWEAIKMDPSLGLKDKLLLPDDKKPQGKHLQTRSDYLLKVLKKYLDQRKGVAKPRKQKRKVKELSKETIEGGGEGSSADEKKSTKQETEDEKKEKKVKKEGGKEKKEGKVKKKKVQGPMHFTANNKPRAVDVLGDLDPGVFDECKEKMRPVKKALKSLDNQDQSLGEHEQVDHTRMCLMQIGDQINKCLAEYKDPEKVKEWRSNLWYFVSKFTEYDAKKLYKLYKHEVKKEQDKKTDGDKEKHKDKEKHRDKEKKKEKEKTAKMDVDERTPTKRRLEDDKETSASPNKKGKPDREERERPEKDRSRSRDGDKGKNERRSQKDGRGPGSAPQHRPGASQNSSRHDYTAGDSRTTASPHGRGHRDRDRDRDRERDRDRFSGDRDHKRDRYDSYSRPPSFGRDRDRMNHRRPFPPGPPPQGFPNHYPFGVGAVPMYPAGDASQMFASRYPAPGPVVPPVPGAYPDYPEFPDWRGPKDFRRDYDRRPPTNS